MKCISEILRDMGWTEQLKDLASRVQKLEPDHRDPHKFHEDKSQIAADLRRLAREERVT